MRQTLFSLLLLVSIAGLATTFAGCGGGMPGMDALANAAGVEMPKTTEVELTVGAVCTECGQQTHQALNPFPEPVKYKTFGIQSVDDFVTKANNTYGAVMVSEKLIDVATKMTENPDNAEIKALGFNDKTQVFSLAKGLLETASQDIPGLITSGQGLVTSLPGEMASNPTHALVATDAVDEVTNAVGRLNEVQSKVTDLMGKIVE